MDFRTLCIQCEGDHHKRKYRSSSDRGFPFILELVLDLLFGKPVNLDLGSIIENDLHKKKGGYSTLQ